MLVAFWCRGAAYRYVNEPAKAGDLLMTVGYRSCQPTIRSGGDACTASGGGGQGFGVRDRLRPGGVSSESDAVSELC